MKDLMNELQISAENILDCLSEGVYVCGLDRRIVLWRKSVERIKRIQVQSMKHKLPDDPRVRFKTFYLPHFNR